jgi:hypothetical protein
MVPAGSKAIRDIMMKGDESPKVDVRVDAYVTFPAEKMKGELSNSQTEIEGRLASGAHFIFRRALLTGLHTWLKIKRIEFMYGTSMI